MCGEEFCRERSEVDGKWCGERAEFIIWGKLYPEEALGPRCYEHARRHVGAPALAYKFSAIYRLGRDYANTS